MLDVLAGNPLLLLFLVAAIGYPLGRIRAGGFSLGVAAVLFVGLAFGALREDVKLPDFVYLLGLVLFVYAVGLASGPGFVAAWRRRGTRDNLFVLAVLVAAGTLTWLAARLLAFQAPLAAGLFAGSLTNTPALAAILESLKNDGATSAAQALPVVAYSVTYPMGVIGMLLAVHWLGRAWRTTPAPPEEIVHQSVRVIAPPAMRVAELAGAHGRRVVFGRLRHGVNLSVPDADTRFERGDVVSVVGPKSEVSAVAAELGVLAEPLEADRRDMDARRIFVSSADVAGRRVRDLHLISRFGALITRVRRGDVDLVPNGDTVLELGDRVRVLCPVARMPEVTRLFGDSYRAVSEVDVVTFAVGVSLGMLLGLIPVPLPGGGTFKLGVAGGPLLVGVLLGALGRTGRVVWQTPYAANLTLRQMGLVLFLAGVGTRSGYAFAHTLGGTGLPLFLAGTVITTFTAAFTLWFGFKVLRVPFDELTGLLAGVQTQPAVLGFALERAGNDRPNVGYATVYPVAMIAKILIAQLLLSLVR